MDLKTRDALLVLLFLSPVFCHPRIPLAFSVRQGWTMDECRSDDSCRAPRTCEGILDEWDSDCNEKPHRCICEPGSTPFCSTALDCAAEGEVCAISKDSDSDTGLCWSIEFVRKVDYDVLDEQGKRTQLKDKGCVAVKHLEGVDKAFEEDFYTEVLCDQRDNCATAGHIVMWDEKVGMMKSYCEHVECERRIMKVNNPKGWGSRIEGNGMTFTKLAAWWEGKAEERILRQVVKVGL